MRTLLALLLGAAVLPVQAQTVNICDRTPAVRDAILSALADYDWQNLAYVEPDCAAVDSDSLASLSAAISDVGRGAPRLDFYLVTTLQGGDFAGLTGLQDLQLNNNQLTTLPEGVFDSLTSLQALRLQNNLLVGLTRNDPLFAVFSKEVDIRLDGQTSEARRPARRLWE